MAETRPEQERVQDAEAAAKKNKAKAAFEAANKKSGKKLNEWIKKRNEHKKGSPEYNTFQNKINAAYGKGPTNRPEVLTGPKPQSAEDKAADEKAANEEEVSLEKDPTGPRADGSGLKETEKEESAPDAMKAKKKPSAKIQARNERQRQRRADRRSGALKQKRKDKRNTRRAGRFEDKLKKANKALGKESTDK